MSTVHSGEEFIKKLRKRPGKSSTNAATARKPFGDNVQAILPIPEAIDGYNKCMGYVDYGDQLRSYYSYTARTHYGWKALDRFLLDIALTNSYLLSYHQPVEPKKRWTVHLGFCVAVYTAMLEVTPQETQETRKRKNYSKVDPALLAQPLHLHHLVQRKAQKDCWVCSSQKRVALGEISGNSTKPKRKRSNFVCSLCDIPLCRGGSCWEVFHRDR